MAEMMTLEQCQDHIPWVITPGIDRFAMDVVFLKSRYIFTHREGRKQFGTCTHCNHQYQTTGLKHNQQATCPGCGSVCVIKASGRGRGGLIDERYFTYYLKSAKDENAIVAVGVCAVRDYRGNYLGVKTQYLPQALYVFRPGTGGTSFTRGWVYYHRGDQQIIGSSWGRATAVKCQWYRGHLAFVDSFYSRENIADVVAGTPFQYSTWEHYKWRDMTEFFDLYASYPCVEYLTKLGLDDLVIDKLRGERTYGAINWRGKTLPRVLKVDKKALRTIRAEGLTLNYKSLRILHLAKKDGSRLTPAEAVEIEKHYYVDDLAAAQAYSSIRRIHRYMSKQSEQGMCHHARPPYSKPREAFRDWQDYLRECQQLGLDLSDERVLFPSNLQKAHQRTTEQVQHMANLAMRKQARQRAKKLKAYCFTEGSLLIRPPVSAQEIIDEGKALRHCVGGYAKRHAEGQTTILLIRRVEEPDKPFYTLEVLGGAIRQCQGYLHCSPTKEVQAFVDAFTAEKLTKQSRRQKPERQEVAV